MIEKCKNKFVAKFGTKFKLAGLIGSCQDSTGNLWP